ncbi:MAG: hypothetical protein RLZZ04_3259 [Cyanobacteriota bacterium]|jgi:hypothetical protein
MIISDLQHIESATVTEVQGGCGDFGDVLAYRPPSHQRIAPPMTTPGGSISPLPYYNVASADAGAQAFGTNTRTSTATSTLVVQGQFSGSSSSSFSAAS